KFITMPPDSSQPSLAKALQDQLALMRKIRGRFAPTRPEYGGVNGMRFGVVRWTGLESMRNVDLTGFLYVAQDGQKLIVIASEDDEAYASETLPITEASALTFRKP